MAALNISVMHDFELIDFAKHYYPATRIFVMSEEDPSSIKNRLDDLRIYAYIRKPFGLK